MASETSDRGETGFEAASGAHDQAQDVFFASAHHASDDDYVFSGHPAAGPSENAANEAVQQVPVAQGANVIRVQVTPGEVLELAPPFTPDAHFDAREANGNLAIKVGDVTVILEGFIDANNTAPVVVESSDGKPIDIATVIAQTDPAIDIQTAAGPAAGAQGQGADNTGAILAQLAGGAGLGGFNAVGGQDGTSLTYGTIDNSILQDRFLPAGALGVPGFSLSGGMSEPVLRDPAHSYAGENYDDFVSGYKDSLTNLGLGYADNNGTQVGSTASVDDYLAATTEHITIPNPSGQPASFNAADFFAGLPVPRSDNQALLVYTSDNGQTAFLVRPSDGAVIMVFHITDSGADGGINIDAILINRIDHPGTSDPAHPGSDSYGDSLQIDFNTSVPDPNGGTQEGSDVPATIPGQPGHIVVQDDVPLAGKVNYTSFYGDDSHAPGGETLSSLAGTPGGHGHASFTSNDFGSVDEDWLHGQKGENNRGNHDQDNTPAGSNSDAAHGDEPGRTHVFGNLDIDFGADGPAGAGGNDTLNLSLTPSTEKTLALGLENIPDVNQPYPDATHQLKSNGNPLVVLEHYVDGKGLEHLIVGYQTTGEGGDGPSGDTIFASTSVISKDGVAVFELTLDVNPNDHNDKGLDFQDFKFELFKGIDQTNDPSGAQPTESDTQLQFGVVGHDDDGDGVHTVINIHVNDDVPVVGGAVYYDEIPKSETSGGGSVFGTSGATDFGHVDEDWLANGNHDTDSNTGDKPGGTIVQGSLTVAFGGDGPAATNPFSFSAANGSKATTQDSAGAPIDLKTSDGHQVYLTQGAGGALIGYTNAHDGDPYSATTSTEVFTLSIDANGHFTFVLEQALQHDVKDTEDNLTLKFDVTATDGDGDTASGTIAIKVNDDAPQVSGLVYYDENPGSETSERVAAVVPSSTSFGHVDEDWLANGNHDTDSNSGDKTGGAIVTGSLTVAFGADGPAAGNPFSFTAGDGSKATAQDSAGGPVDLKTADGHQVYLTHGTDGALIGYANATGDTSYNATTSIEVFKLSIDGNGNFTFELEQALQHDVKDTEDNLTLKLDVTATDGDGDTATTTIQIKINDDAPQAYDDCPDAKVVSGNLFAATEPTIGGQNKMGADGGGVSSIQAMDVKFQPVTTVAPTGITDITGAYGVLHIDALGEWTYTVTDPKGSHDDFKFTLTDGDGDTASATLTVTVSVATPSDDESDFQTFALHTTGPTHTEGSYDHQVVVTKSISEDSYPTLQTFHMTDANGGHTIGGGGGNDLIVVTGSNGSAISGNGGDDIIHVAAGHNVLHGNAGDDTLFGGSGANSFFGDAGHDAMSGGGGNDVFYNVDAQDLDGTNTLDGIHSIDGGDGIDRVDLHGLATFDSSQAGHIENVEKLDFTGTAEGGGGTQVTLSYDAVYGTTQVGGLSPLQISGDANGAGKDTVHLDATGGNHWSFVGTTGGFDTYSATGSHGTVTVQVEHGVHTDIN